MSRTHTAEPASAGAGAGEQQVAGEVAVDGDAVGRRRSRQWPSAWAPSRVHALLDAALRHQRHAEQLDAVAEVVGGLDVGLAMV
jgi:hypothetical protein